LSGSETQFLFKIPVFLHSLKSAVEMQLAEGFALKQWLMLNRVILN